MKRAWLLVGVLVLLSACAPTTYSRPGTGQSQAERDAEACRFEGMAYYTERLPRAEDYDVAVETFGNVPSDLRFDLERAAERAVRSEHESYFERQVNRYIPDCMSAKGYQTS